MRAEISDLHNRLQATMIYVTHDQVEAMTMGTKIVVMSEKRIQQVGSPIYLYDHPINKFVAGFIGTTPMNFFKVPTKTVKLLPQKKNRDSLLFLQSHSRKHSNLMQAKKFGLAFAQKTFSTTKVPLQKITCL